MNSLTLFVVCAAAFGLCAGGPAARLAGGQELESFAQFSHHVVISSLGVARKCGGSILNAHWILTSAACVKNRTILNLYIGRSNIKSSIGDFLGVTVKNEQIHVFDSLALIELIKPIQFSDTIGTVAVSKSSVDGLSNRFAVMPGFSEGILSTFSSANLRYGMFKIQELAECRKAVGGGEYRDDRRLCTKGWGGSVNSPCESDMGSGLIVGWPSRSEIVGVLSEAKCDAGSLAVYVHVGKYLSWIEDTISK